MPFFLLLRVVWVATVAGVVTIVAAQDVGPSPPSTPAGSIGNFTETCTQAVLQASHSDGTLDFLRATCLEIGSSSRDSGRETNNNRAWHNSTLDLNLCIGIDYTTAALVWSYYGKFSNYCTDCHVQGGTTLACSCATLSNVRRRSTINLDSGIENRNGTLACEGGIGS